MLDDDSPCLLYKEGCLGKPQKRGGALEKLKKIPFLLTFFILFSQSKIKHILFKGFFIRGGGWYLRLPRYKITYKYGSFSQKTFGKNAAFLRLPLVNDAHMWLPTLKSEREREKWVYMPYRVLPFLFNWKPIFLKVKIDRYLYFNIHIHIHNKNNSFYFG